MYSGKIAVLPGGEGFYYKAPNLKFYKNKYSIGKAN
jgi:hypothetical protein